MLHRIPPAYSPLDPSSLLRGLVGLLSSSRAHRDQMWLEGALKIHSSVRRVILTDSGTSALMLALRLARQQAPQRPVALPAFGCPDIATAADGAGGRVLLYDVDPATLAPEPSSFEAAVAEKPGALVVAHLYGVPIDTARLRDSCRAADVLIIEDAAQAFGATLHDQPVGTFGSLAVMSFGRGKGITGGRGGALIAMDERGEALLGRLGGLGHPRRAPAYLVALWGQWLMGRPALYGLPSRIPFLHLGQTRYHPPREPQRIRAPAPSVLRATWSACLREVQIRRRLARSLRQAVEGHSGYCNIEHPIESEPGYLRFPFVATQKITEDARVAAADLGIMRPYPMALCDLDGFSQSVANHDASFEGARYLAGHMWTAPVHSQVTHRLMDRIKNWFRL